MVEDHLGGRKAGSEEEKGPPAEVEPIGGSCSECDSARPERTQRQLGDEELEG